VGGAEGRRRGKRVSNRNVFLLLQAFLSFLPPPSLPFNVHSSHASR
jgi:hypothetical protein